MVQDIFNSLGINPKFILVMAVGFVFLMLILKKFAFGPLLAMLNARQDNIKSNLDEAQSRRDEMVRLQEEYRQRLNQIEDEARDKVQAAVKEAQAARDEILAKAQLDREAIVQRGGEEMQREREKAMVQMRDELANLAIDAASRVVKQNLTGASHAHLIDDVINGVGANGTVGAAGGKL